MTHLKTDRPCLDRSCTDADVAERELAGAVTVARHALDDHWTPDELAQILQILGLDVLPPVRRALARHGLESPAAPPGPPLAPVENLLAAVLTVSLADAGDHAVLATLEATEDHSERVSLLTSDGVTPRMAAVYAELDATLVRLAFADPGAALDGLADRAGTPAARRGSGVPEEAA